MMYFEFGQNWLPQAHPLNALELGQRPVEVSLETCLISEQVIELRR